MSEQLVEIKGEMSLLTVLQLNTCNLQKVKDGLQKKRDSLPHFFEHSPLVIDCRSLGDSCAVLDLKQLRELILGLGFVPVGLRNIPEDFEEQAVASGWGVLHSGRTATTTRIERPVVLGPDTTVSRVTVIERPVRSGQQVYFPDGDVVVLQHTGAGSEVLAGGSIHVYGSLRGRVLAGIQGDTTTRIFCQKLEAELVSIAGHYRLLDDIETDLKGQPAMVWLDGEKLRIDPLV